MRSAQHCLLCAGVCALLATPPASAHAEQASPPSAPPSRDRGPIPRIDLAIVGAVANGDAISGRVLSFFTGENTTSQTRRIELLDPNEVFAPAGFAGVRVWLSMPEATTARLVFAVQEEASALPRFLVRDVTLDGGLDEVGQEQLAQVVYLSAQALWAGTVETSQQEVEASLARSRQGTASSSKARPKARSSPPEPATPSFEFGPEYVLRNHGDEGLSHSLGATFGASLPLAGFRPGARLHVGFTFPRSAEKESLRLELGGGNARVGLAPAWRLSQSVWMTTEAGPGLDLVRFSPTFDESAVAPEESRWDFRPFVYAGVELRWALHGLSLGLGALLAVQLQRTHYDVADDAARSEVLVPAVVQPALSAGVLW